MARGFRATETWLNEHLQSRGKKTPAKASRSKSAAKPTRRTTTSDKSPHRAALERLERNPSLIEGCHEHYLQVRLFDRVERLHPDIYPHMHATPNGGMRSIKTAIAMRAEGQKSGYPDLSLDVARGIYHGLRIELKAGDNRPTPGQKEWLNRLSGQGYCCAVFNELDQAIDFIVAYWALQPGEVLQLSANDSWWKERDV